MDMQQAVVTVRRGKRRKQILDDLRKREDVVTVRRGKRRKQILDDLRKRGWSDSRTRKTTSADTG